MARKFFPTRAQKNGFCRTEVKSHNMIEFLKKLLKRGPALNIEELLSRGAVIVDVRTEREFKSGHAQGSINIPLDKIPKNISRLNKNKPIITCCASGMRSATATRLLKQHGFAEVYNAGSWMNVRQKTK